MVEQNEMPDQPELARPAVVKQEHLEYLDALRESKVTNMYGAGAYLEEAFGLSRKDAKVVLLYWMDTFGKER